MNRSAMVLVSVETIEKVPPCKSFEKPVEFTENIDGSKLRIPPTAAITGTSRLWVGLKLLKTDDIPLKS